MFTTKINPSLSPDCLHWKDDDGRRRRRRRTTTDDDGGGGGGGDGRGRTTTDDDGDSRSYGFNVRQGVPFNGFERKFAFLSS